MTSLQDHLNLFSKITLKRSWNALKVLSSYYISQNAKKAFHKGLPISIAIEPTTSCNLRCPECPSGLRAFTRPTGMLEEATFKKIIDELAETLLYLTFYFQGEPYLNPKFLDWVQYASQKKIYTSTSTNAHYLHDTNAKKTIESGLDRLIISIDGTTQETYQQYRVGGNLEKVLKGTENLINWRSKLNSKKPYTIFQFLVVQPNEHQIEDAKQLAKNIGVDKIAFKTAQIYDYEAGSSLIPTLENYSRYKKQPDGSYKFKNELLNQCWRMWQACVITWDGKVVPCCFDKDAHHVLGDINETSFSELWKSESYNNFRQQLLVSRNQIDICQNCTEGTKVWESV
jgi:radical SAM protein with 4Fe4S-binding SPASM domain